MNDKKPAWRVNSGMMARLTGTYRAQQPVPDETKLRAERQILNVPDFQQMRDLIFYCLADAYRTQQPISLLVLTIDDFFAFETNYGREAATKATGFIEETLAHHRDLIFGPESGAVTGRYVENRYLIILPGISGAIAADYAEYLRKATVAAEFIWNYRALHFTVSIGVSYKPGHQGDQDMLILQADQACDQVIACGGNRVAVAKVTKQF